MAYKAMPQIYTEQKHKEYCFSISGLTERKVSKVWHPHCVSTVNNKRI
jgi:hypothetical protein